MTIMRKKTDTSNKSKGVGIQRPAVYQVIGKDYKGRLAQARDTTAYAQAEVERPVYKRGDIVEEDNVYGDPEEYGKALSDWTEKYGTILGRGQERYDKEKSFLEQAQNTIIKEQAYKEVSPYGVGKNVNELLSNPDKYEVVETYESGAPKKIQEKAKVYTSGSGFGGNNVSNYIPYEAILTEDGKLKEEKFRDIGISASQWQKGWGTSTQYSPYEKSVLLYTNGIPQKLKAQTMFKKKGESSKGWGYSYYDVAPEVEIDFTDIGTLKNKSVYDIGQQTWQARGGYGGTSQYGSFLDKFYDYTKGEMTDYPTPLIQESYGGYIPSKETLEALQNQSQSNNGQVISKAPVSRILTNKVQSYNPFTGSVRINNQSLVTQPQLTKFPSQSLKDIKSNVFENPFKPGKFISQYTNPITNKNFNSQEEYLEFWNNRQNRFTELMDKKERVSNILSMQNKAKDIFS